MSVRVAIAGATGRMGQVLLRLAAGDARFRIVGALTIPSDPRIGEDAGRVAGLEPIGVELGAALGGADTAARSEQGPAPGEPVRAICDCLIEFTTPDGTEAWARWCGDNHVALVSGTTGLHHAQRDLLRETARTVPVVWSANMSTGVNLMLAVVEELARKLDESWDVEIIEAHHRRKVDAPSGTAQALLDAAARGRGRRGTDVAVHGRSGKVGARPVGQIGVHAVRMGAIVGEHEVHFASDAEALTVAHRAFSRETFAAGALQAARWTVGRAPGLYGMRDVLFG